MRIEAPPVDLIILAGDHHGKYEELKAQIERFGLKNALILHVGDGNEGCPGFHKETMTQLDEWMRQRNCHYWSIRGNHSDPSFFQGQWLLPNAKLLPDYSRATLAGKEWLFVGGAVSIDRSETIPGISWWEGENFQETDEPLEPCDVLVTHTGPPWIQMEGKSGLVAHYEHVETNLFGDSDLWEQIQEESKALERLFQKTRPHQWFLGHFHQHKQVTEHGCITTIVAMEELMEYRASS